MNLIFLAVVLLVLRPRLRAPSKKWILMFVALIAMTAVFDSLIIYFEIVGYDTSKILGLMIGYAPIEDFFYAILAAILVPVVWNKLGAKKA